jgi:cation-transporting ATPase I
MAGKPTAPGGVQAQLNEITSVALPVTGVSGALVSALAVVRGVPLRQAVASGVAVAVAAVPEGLSLVATVAQLAAARRLSRRGVLVRSSRTLGTMGRVDTVCFDKTGTLTEGRLRLSRLTGVDGEFSWDSEPGQRLLAAAWRACPDGNGRNPKLARATDRAIAEAGQDKLGQDTGWKPASVLPFETSRGYSAAEGTADGRPYLSAKGTPEEIVARCYRIAGDSGTLELTGRRRRDALGSARRLAEAGLRVLAVADGNAERDGADGLEKISGLTLLGFVGIADTPRPQAMSAIKRLTEAGVQVAMITGDHPDTARTIAAELGIPGADHVLTGPELDRLTEDERMTRVGQTAVFARATPEHKVRIVQALQRVGRTVAVTGDGVNDAAAIRLGDVGIAVTGSRTRAARSAADMIAQNTELESIADAMLEGQSLWHSVANAVSILVGGNAGEVAFTLYGTAVGGRAPLGTRQLLLVNILTDMLPALAVALAPPAGGAAQESRPVHDGLRKTLVPGIAVRGGATALGAIVAWHAGRATGRARRASTMSLASLVLTQLAQTLQTGWRSPAVLATGTVSALVLAGIIQTPGVSQFFGCTPLGPVAWTCVAGSAAAGTGAAVLVPRFLPRFLPQVLPVAGPAPAGQRSGPVLTSDVWQGRSG